MEDARYGAADVLWGLIQLCRVCIMLVLKKHEVRRTYKSTSIFIPAIFCLVIKTDSKAELLSDKGRGTSKSAVRRELE
jgi:hypothetical protein